MLWNSRCINNFSKKHDYTYLEESTLNEYDIEKIRPDITFKKPLTDREKLVLNEFIEDFNTADLNNSKDLIKNMRRFLSIGKSF